MFEAIEPFLGGCRLQVAVAQNRRSAVVPDAVEGEKFERKVFGILTEGGDSIKYHGISPRMAHPRRKLALPCPAVPMVTSVAQYLHLRPDVLKQDAAKSRYAFAAIVNQSAIFLGLRALPLLPSIG